MTRKTILVLAALIAAFALMLTGCGAKGTAETTAAPAADTSLGLQSWEMSATTWSSPNGATIHVTATPNSRTDDQYAVFSVRLEGDDVQNIPCDWDGTHYTAAAELNAADGYCYYVILTAADGAQTEVPVNTPTNPTDEALINMETALTSYCNLTVVSSQQEGSKLTLTSGAMEVQVPRITNAGESITIRSAVLVLTFNDEEVDTVDVAMSESEVPGGYEADVAGISFDIPSMEDDQQLAVRLDVTLSNDQTLTALGCTWSYMNGELISAVG